MLNSIKIFLLKKLNKSHVFCENDVRILGQLPHFKLPRNGKVFLGNKVVLNSDFKKTNTALTYRCKFVTGYDGLIKIGNNTMLNGVCIVSYKKVVIGEECQIASSTIISDTDFHPVDPKLRSRQVKGESFPFDSVGKQEIKIGNNVWIGWNCTILKGVEIGDDSIVAAGSVVLAGKYPNGSLIAGNPAKVIKSYI
ncbi:Maltose O-acetyltransferase [Acinetobacter guillouiae MSP4-18]|uniref:acyltransferase n=1 Tax=Acinetobacter guillouiae TaxID=106649 RepID=UPI0002D0063E|nr:acyltransferase [Acinetobacter guillouiae]ENU57530.1 hypothetical protein F981_03508 [Acinetobacter guillouiae CIP 63.46]EPH34565.1 Maltose O-acetyltransferase [Acinetobacter guillouiae MSP4-18]KAB0625022.1 acyltransferase [Acinetobacter guillouiae]